MRKQVVILALCGLVAGGVPLQSAGPPSVIPRPLETRLGNETFTLDAGMALVVPAGERAFRRSAEIFQEKAARRFGVELEVLEAGGQLCGPGETGAGSGCVPCSRAIVASRGPGACAPGFDPPVSGEGYAILVRADNVAIRADAASGFHNALATLLQLAEAGPRLPALEIRDAPLYRWRGLLLDPARMFIPPDMIKQEIDRMSELKLNVFHFHLTDDQGFRFESRAFPRLHEAGGDLAHQPRDKRRALAAAGYDLSARGYYTREEIREIVAFAGDRNVMVVPEIDAPGHASAMLAAYPELSCSGEGAPVREVSLGIFPTALCPGKEEVYEFLDGLFGEVAELFPAPYVHVGADEVMGEDWLSYPPNRALMEEHGFEGRDGLHGYFVGRVAKLLRGHGKTAIGWDEIAGHVPEGAVVQAWRSHEAAAVAARQGHPAIVSLTRPHYLNYSPFLHTMRAIYEFDHAPEGVSAGQAELIWGGEVCLWGRQPSVSDLDEKLYPRLMAHAESVWTPLENRDFADFRARLSVLKSGWQARGVDFGPTWREPF